jgi:hypothetical protein
MRTILDFYLGSALRFHTVNIIFAVIIPILICLLLGFHFKELLIEAIIGIIMTPIITSILGGYSKLKVGYETYKNGK